VNTNPFQALINLVTFDQQVLLHKQAIDKLLLEEQQFEEQRNAYNQELEEVKKVFFDARKQVDMHELLLQETEAQERQKKDALENLAHYKEYQSIKAELEHIQAIQQQEEKEVINAWSRLEAAQDTLSHLQPTVEKKIEALNHLSLQNQSTLKIHENAINAMLSERPQREASITPEWLEKYNIMKARVPNPMVPIQQNSCSACFYPMTGQDIANAQRGGLVQCKGCYRLLFLESVHGSYKNA
jgi:predicted  nucleic acid-binding Zn-ribbon protein